MFSGRSYVIPSDVTYVYADVCAHRVIPARVKGRLPGDVEVRQILENICGGVAAPKL